jgi:MFS family permease
MSPSLQNAFPALKSLQYRDFRWLWMSTFAAFMAISMQMITRGWLILRLTDDSPLALSLVMMSFALPMTIVSPFGGALADRFSRRKIILLTQSVNAMMTLLLATLDITGLIRFWHLIVTGVANGTMASLNMPSRQSIVSDMVPPDDLMNAISLNSSGMNITRIVGPALAGVLIVFLDTAGVLYLIALAYAIAVLFTVFIREGKKRERKKGRGMVTDILDGVKYAKGDPTLLGLLILCFVPALFGFPYVALLPAWSKEVLNAGSDGLGLLMTCMGIGSLIGTLVLASLRKVTKRGFIIMACSLVWGLLLTIFSLCVTYPTALSVVFLLGFISAFFMALNMSLLQYYASERMRGRIVSLAMMTFGIMPLSAVPFGAVAERIGTDDSLMIAGLLLCLFAFLFFLAYPKFRQVS